MVAVSVSGPPAFGTVADARVRARLGTWRLAHGHTPRDACRAGVAGRADYLGHVAFSGGLTPPDDVVLLQLGGFPEIMAGLQGGATEGALLSPPFTLAARKAGYRADKPETLRVIAHQVAHHPKVQAAILEEAKKRLQLGTGAAAALLLDTIGDSKVERHVRLRAAESVLDRGGLHARKKRRQ